jgi:hypothetical protein
MLRYLYTFSFGLVALVQIRCQHTSIERSSESAFEHGTEVWSFILTEYNNIIFKTTLNGIDTLHLKFDSGCTGLLLTHEAIASKTSLLNDSTEATPTQNYVPLKQIVSLQIGDLSWDSLEVYPVRHSGQGSDGRFGWDLFEGKVLEINYDRKEMLIRNSLPNEVPNHKTALENINGLLCFSGKMTSNDSTITGRYLFDTGYQKSLLLDSAYAAAPSFLSNLKLIKQNKLRNGAGKVFYTNVVELPASTMAGLTLSSVPTQILTTHNPAGFATHIAGNELLKRYNTIVDLQTMQIYFEPNSLLDEPYSDAL